MAFSLYSNLTLKSDRMTSDGLFLKPRENNYESDSCSSKFSDLSCNSDENKGDSVNRGLLRAKYDINLLS